MDMQQFVQNMRIFTRSGGRQWMGGGEGRETESVVSPSIDRHVGVWCGECAVCVCVLVCISLAQKTYAELDHHHFPPPHCVSSFPLLLLAPPPAPKSMGKEHTSTPTHTHTAHTHITDPELCFSIFLLPHFRFIIESGRALGRFFKSLNRRRTLIVEKDWQNFLHQIHMFIGVNFSLGTFQYLLIWTKGNFFSLDSVSNVSFDLRFYNHIQDAIYNKARKVKTIYY